MIPNEPGSHNPGCQTRLRAVLWLAAKTAALCIGAVLITAVLATAFIYFVPVSRNPYP